MEDQKDRIQPQFKKEHYKIDPEDGWQDGDFKNVDRYTDPKNRYFKGKAIGTTYTTSDTRITGPFLKLVYGVLTFVFTMAFLVTLIAFLSGEKEKIVFLVIWGIALLFILYGIIHEHKEMKKREKEQTEEAGVSVEEWRASGRKVLSQTKDMLMQEWKKDKEEFQKSDKK